MHLVTYQDRTGQHVGVLSAGRILDARACLAAHLLDIETARLLVPDSMLGFLANGAHAQQTLRSALATGHAIIAPPEAQLCAPIPRPGKVLGVGRNYAEHLAEANIERQPQPRMFVKVSSSVIGPDAVIRKRAARQMDWEVELGVVIGRLVQDVAPANALDYVAGYTIVNDVSAREFQFELKPTQTSFAKSLDGYTPMGPAIVTADEIPDPQNLRLRLELNGEVMQDANTSDMIYSVADIVSFVSRYVTLEPGDVISTGSPSGVGCFRTPPRYLQPGDRMKLSIAGLGVLENTVVA